MDNLSMVGAIMTQTRIINNALYDIMINTQHSLISNGLIDYTSDILFVGRGVDMMQMRFAIAADRSTATHDWRSIVSVLEYEVTDGFGWNLSKLIYDHRSNTKDFILGTILVWQLDESGDDYGIFG